jgi:hypothetical protein
MRNECFSHLISQINIQLYCQQYRNEILILLFWVSWLLFFEYESLCYFICLFSGWRSTPARIKLTCSPKPEESQKTQISTQKTIPYLGFKTEASGLPVSCVNHCCQFFCFYTLAQNTNFKKKFFFVINQNGGIIKHGWSGWWI